MYTREPSEERSPSAPPVHGAAEKLPALLTVELRDELYRHCYHMLGSIEDAEDAMQEVLISVWRGFERFERRSSFRTWAHKITANVCLSALRTRARRPQPSAPWPDNDDIVSSAVEVWPSRVTMEEMSGSPHDRYERRESLELAFVAALHHLPPNQRAALILRDVLGFNALEASEAVGTSQAAMNSALQHARSTIRTRDGQIHTPEQAPADVSKLAEKYVNAFERADLVALLELLGRDTTWAMPPYDTIYRGKGEIEPFLKAGPLTYSWRHLVIELDGQPAVACYARQGSSGDYEAQGIDLLHVEGGHIDRITSLLDPRLFPVLGLPARLDGATAPLSP